MKILTPFPYPSDRIWALGILIGIAIMVIVHSRMKAILGEKG